MRVTQESFGLSLNELLRRAEIDWHGVRLGRPDWAVTPIASP